jgi:tetratricopeptide (TPR) repeat protein
VMSTNTILMQLGECYLHTDDLELADGIFEKLKVELIKERDSESLLEVLKNMGVLEMKRKQFEIAVYHFKQALEELGKVELLDDYKEAEILFIFGTVYEKQGKIKQAIELFEQAKSLFEGKRSTREMANVYAELSRSYHRLNDSQKSMEYSDRAFALYQSLKNRYMSVQVQLTAAIAYRQSGRLEKAVKTFETVIEQFHELGRKEDEGIAYVELAKVYFELGDRTKTGESCGIARGLLPELHFYQGWVNRIQGQLVQQLGETNVAIRYLQAAGDCFKRYEEVGVWADTMVELSRLKFQKEDVSDAFSIMENIVGTTRLVLNDRGIVF